MSEAEYAGTFVNGAVLAFYERLGYTQDQVVSLGKRLIPMSSQRPCVCLQPPTQFLIGGSIAVP